MLLMLLAPAPVAATGDASVSGVDPPPAGGCVRATCAWSLETRDEESPWPASVEEVAPAASESSAWHLVVENASRAGTFYFTSPPRAISPVPQAFSVWLRSSGDLDRFPLLVRELGYDGAEAHPERGDTTFFVAPSPEWRFVSFEWRPRHADATHVQVALRGELQAGASAGVEFAHPYFGPDLTRWYLDEARAPFAVGPQSGHTFDEGGSHTVRAVLPDGGTRTFSVEGPSIEAEPALAIGPSPAIPGGVRVTADHVRHEFHPELLENGDFRRGLSEWTLAPYELGPSASVALEDGAARVRVARAPEEGSVWLAQQVSWTRGEMHEFVWRAHDDRGILRYQLVVLESDGTRHNVTAAPGGELGAGGVFRFRPTTSGGEIQLRAILIENTTGTVWFEHASLRRAFDYAWTLDGQPLATSGPVIDFAIDRTLNHTLALRITDAAGTPSVARHDLPPDTAQGTSALVLRHDPRAGLVGAPVTLDLSPTWEGATDVLATPVPWQGWRLEDGEMPGLFRVERRDEFLRVDAGPLPEGAGGGIDRLVAAPSHAHAYDLMFQYRTEGDVHRVQALARFHVPGELPYAEARANFTPSSDWRAVHLRVPAAPAGHTILLLGLREIVLENGTGSVWFSNVTLAPALHYEWRGALGSGPIANVSAKTPGVVAWSVRASAPGGVVLERAGLVGFTPPLVPYATLHEGVRARWNASHFPDGVSIGLEGPAAATAAASAAQAQTITFAPGNYTVWATTAGGQRALLGYREITDRSSLVGVPLAWNGSRAGTTNFSFDLPNPDLSSVTLVLERGGQSIHVPLVRDGTMWNATWTAPIAWLPGETHAALLLAEPSGSETRVGVGVVDVAPAPGRADDTLLLVLLVGTVATAAWMPRHDIRRRLARLATPMGDGLATLLGASVALASMSVDFDSVLAVAVTLSGASFLASVATTLVRRPATRPREDAVQATVVVAAAGVLSLGLVIVMPAAAPLILIGTLAAWPFVVGLRALLRHRRRPE